MTSRRSVLKLAAAGAAFTIIPSMRRARAASDAMSIGYIPDFPNGSIFAIANELKLWDAEGVTPDIKVFTNGPIQIQAMGAGSLNFGTIGPGALWLPATGRARVVGVNDIGFSDRVIAQGNINSIADLKGKSVGVPQGTSGDMILRMALGKAGMTVADIKLVPMDPSTIVAAFTSRQIDAAGIWYPLIDTIKPRVPDMKELASNKDFYPATSFINTYVARNEVVDQNPELTKKFIRIAKKASDWRVANLEKAIELTTSFLKAPANLTANVAHSRKLLNASELDSFTKDGTVNKWLGDFNKLFVDFGTIKEPLAPEKYFDARMWLEA